MQSDLRPLFDDRRLAFYGVSVDPRDEGQLQQSLPGIRYFLDFNGAVSRMYGALAGDTGERMDYRPFTLVLDERLRVIANIPWSPDTMAHNERLTAALRGLPPLPRDEPAPVLVLPRVLEPDFCKELVDLHIRDGGAESPFMRQHGKETVPILDYGFKRRTDFDFEIEPQYESLRLAIRNKLNRRLSPEVLKAFQFKITRIERYLVARYDGDVGGFFRPHRDNTTRATAHRKFACTINLNAEDYEGGNLRFPEYSERTYRAPTGGAVVFSCSLLHEAQPVTKGTRYAFLPFFYDDAGAKLRRRTERFLSEEVIDKHGQKVIGKRVRR